MTKRQLRAVGLPLTLPVLVLFLLACSGGEPAAAPNAAAAGGTPLSFVTKSGKQPVVYAEIAETIEQLNIGLSRRQHLPPDAGMLFVLPFRGPGFWMKDTTIPLSVAFIAACGEIVGMADMQPLSEQLHQSEADYRFGLEVNQGWFVRNGVAVGDRLILPPHLKQPGCP